MTSLLASLGGALSSVISMFNPFKPPQPPSPARKRNQTHKRLNLQHLINKCKKGSTQHSVYRKILAKRLSQQLRQNKKNSVQQTFKSTTKTLAIKSKKAYYKKQQHKSASIIRGHNNRIRVRSNKNLPSIPPATHYDFCDDGTLQSSGPMSYVIPSLNLSEIYAPSAPLWTPPPSPRRGSLPDLNLTVSYPPHTPTVNEYPNLLYEGFLLSPSGSAIPVSPPCPTAPPALETFPSSIRPPPESKFLQPTNPASPPFSSPLVRRHFAQYYIPQVKTNIPYVRSPPQLNPTSQFSFPAPYAPTGLDVQYYAQ